MPLARPWTAAAWVFLLAAGLAWPHADGKDPAWRTGAGAMALAALLGACCGPRAARMPAILLAAAAVAVVRAPGATAAEDEEGWPVRLEVTLLTWHAEDEKSGWGRVRLESEPSEAASRSAGREVLVRGTWSAPLHPRPGQRARVEAWLRRERGLDRLDRARLEPIPGGRVLPLALLRQAAHERLHVTLEPAQAGLAVALLLGEWSELQPELEERYRRLGLLHVLAVSGLHLWLWDALLRVLLRGRCVALRWTLLTALAALAGLGPAVLRAWLALALRAWVQSRGRSVEGGRLWSLALFTEVALLRPERQGLGFLLSYSATGALLTTPQAPHAPAWRRSLRASCAGFLGSLPWMVAAQGSAEPWGILATPLFGLLLPPRIVLAALAWLPGGGALAQPALELLDALDAALAAPFLRMPGTPLEASRWPLPAALLCAACGLLALRALARRGGGRAAAGFVLGAALAACARSSHAPGVMLLPVGHGLGFVAAGEERGWILDLGSREASPRSVVDRILLPELRERRWPWPQVSLLTHEDADHSGGLRLLESRGGVQRLRVAAGETRDDSTLHPYRARVLGCRAAVVGVRNAAGPVLDLVRSEPGRAEWRAVILGDQFGFALRDLCTRLEPGPIDLLVLPHHGLTTDGLGELLDHLRPREAWAASGELPETLPAFALCARRGIPLHTTRLGALTAP